jgi:hypothetical protein
MAQSPQLAELLYGAIMAGLCEANPPAQRFFFDTSNPAKPASYPHQEPFGDNTHPVVRAMSDMDYASCCHCFGSLSLVNQAVVKRLWTGPASFSDLDIPDADPVQRKHLEDVLYLKDLGFWSGEKVFKVRVPELLLLVYKSDID